ncbi:DUF4865 family protein [Pseudomonas typographi]|uniref:DUF4865 family protein n=1 Tax=Pseudomonas typographi TaxID=2715964 RepID=UPI0016889390|nr:DUF4865 family protein [Pseudomonas typographi]MBD1551249.1 DUF4865 family protein [Pseudomonas typographi]
MPVVHYSHRLPSDYDLAIIRRRALQRGPQWDALPGLRFKAFLLGEQGATARYGSLYLWQATRDLRDFLLSGRYQGVIDSFGRAPISTWLPLDARLGDPGLARFAHLAYSDLPQGLDLASQLAEACQQNQAHAREPGVAASVLAVDAERWRLLQVVLSADPGQAPGQMHEVLYLARPHWAEG